MQNGTAKIPEETQMDVAMEPRPESFSDLDELLSKMYVDDKDFASNCI